MQGACRMGSALAQVPSGVAACSRARKGPHGESGEHLSRAGHRGACPFPSIHSRARSEGTPIPWRMSRYPRRKALRQVDGSVVHQVVVEIAPCGKQNSRGDAEPCATPLQPARRALARFVAVLRDNETGDVLRRHERTEAAGGQRRCGKDCALQRDCSLQRGCTLQRGTGQDRDHGQHGFDPLAHQQRGGGGRFAEPHGAAVDPAERLARRLTRACPGMHGVERPVHPVNAPVVVDRRDISASR